MISVTSREDSVSPNPSYTNRPPPSLNFSTFDVPEDDQFAQYLYQSHHIANPYQPAIEPPELVLEVPSDSDSSRRPSQAPSEYSQFTMSPSPSCNISPAHSNRSLYQADELFVAARKGRRASHGELASMSQSPSSGFSPSLLGIPSTRLRGASLPGDIEVEELYRLRNFSIKGRKVINRGDSFKSRSRTSLNSRRSRY